MRERLNDAGVLSVCKVEGCTNRSIAKYLCNKHRKRLNRNGSPYILQKRPYGTGTIAPNGYLVTSMNRKNVLKQREIMAAHLGRPLNSNEEVHHVNLNRLDNRIENLVVMSKSAHKSLHGKLRKYHRVKGKFSSASLENTNFVNAKSA